MNRNLNEGSKPSGLFYRKSSLAEWTVGVQVLTLVCVNRYLFMNRLLKFILGLNECCGVDVLSGSLSREVDTG